MEHICRVLIARLTSLTFRNGVFSVQTFYRSLRVSVAKEIQRRFPSIQSDHSVGTIRTSALMALTGFSTIGVYPTSIELATLKMQPTRLCSISQLSTTQSFHKKTIMWEKLTCSEPARGPRTSQALRKTKFNFQPDMIFIFICSPIFLLQGAQKEVLQTISAKPMRDSSRLFPR